MRKSLLGFVALLITFAACTPKEKTPLALNLTQGSTYYQEMVASSVIDQEIMGQKQNIQMEISGNISYTVVGINGDVYELSTQYQKLAMKMTNGVMGTLVFSSEDGDTTNQLSLPMKNMVNKPFTVFMKKDGSITEIKGIEDIITSLFDGMNGMDSARMQQAVQQLKSTWGNNAFKSNVETMTAMFPTSGTAAVGDKWEKEINLQTIMQGGFKTTYTLTEVKPDYLLITGNGKIEADKDTTKFVNINGMQARYNLNGDMTSEIKIDPATGWIMSAKLTQDFGGDILIKMGQQGMDDMKMPMNVKTEMVVTGGTK